MTEMPFSPLLRGLSTAFEDSTKASKPPIRETTLKFSSMDKKAESGRTAAPPRPTITLPPRPSMEAFFTGGPGASPGPMTLVSSFFADNQSDSPEFRSFSQLLAGAMGSPMPMGFFGSNTTQNSSFKEGGGAEKELGFKQSRPVNLVVARSPMFTVPPGLSPSGLLNSPGFFSPQSPFGMSHQQVLAQVTAQAALSQSQMHGQAPVDYPPASAPPTDSLIRHPSFTVDEASQQSMSDPKSSMMELAEVSHSDRKYQPPADKPTDDGYNWRKYGQKQVKGSEFPRSYYKCTHQKCPVKKKVERSPDGQITEIIIKGQHNHEPPQPNKRSKDGGEATALVHTLPESEFGSHIYGGNVNKTSEIVQVGFSDSEELCETEITEDRDFDEPNPKRQNIDAGTSGGSLPHKTLTEPKIIVQTRSEVDLLDDGYRWRKYGQKLVKGNPYPRSYYRCTFVGCNVRKHVERASTDPKAVITTYEGKHSHDVPAARNSSHNTANNNTLQIKPQRAVAQKHQLLKEMNFGSKEKGPIVLQLKEEQITV